VMFLFHLYFFFVIFSMHTACRTYAMSMMSVCLSVTLVDCDYTKQHKVEMGM